MRKRWIEQLVVTVSLLISSQVSAESVSEVMVDRDGKLEVWLPADEAMDQTGEIDWDRLARLPFNSLNPAYIDPTEAGCLEILPMDQDSYDGYPAFDTLRDLSLHALGIFTGRVAGTGHGFYLGRPGTLLEVEIEGSLRRDPRYRFGQTFFLFYPKGDFKIGALTLCVVDPDLPPVPQLGDRILIYDFDLARDSGGRLLSPLNTAIFVQRAGGALESPRRWRTEVSEQGLDSLTQLSAVSRQLLVVEGEDP